METIIPRIKRKIVAVQRKAAEGTIEQWRFAPGTLNVEYYTEPGSLHVFGADRHKWRLSEPLSEVYLAQWEADMGVSLPNEYRQFISEVGYQGMGPYYGLARLAPEVTKLHRVAPENLWMAKDYQAPCVYKEGIEGDSDEWLVAAAGADWEARWDAETFDPHQGTLTLCEQGCGYSTVIVLNGAYRGRVVNACHTDPPRFAPYDGFFAWYEGWLDEVLSGRVRGWYGYPPRKPKDEVV